MTHVNGMFRFIGAFALVLTAVVTRPAQGSAVLVNGSTYDVVLVGDLNPTSFYTLTVNGNTQTINYNGVDVAATLSEASLGPGQYQLTLDLAAASDIFPGTGNALVNIGGFSNPMDLITPLNLTSAIVTFKNGLGNTIASANFIGAVPNTTPWDGFFTASGVAGGFVGIEGRDTQDIQVQLNLSAAAPMPSAAAAGPLLILGFAVLRWRASAAARGR